MKGPRTSLFLSYYGPEEAASGIRVGRLARAAVRGGERVILVHGSEQQERRLWDEGIELVTFRRPFWRPHRAVRHPGLGRRGVGPRTAAAVAKTMLQPDRFILDHSAFFACATAAIARLRSSGERFTVIASCPPWSTALIALHLARDPGIRIVTDLQDLWASNPEARWPPFGRQLAARWQRRLLAAIHGFLFVNEHIALRFDGESALVRTKPRAIAPIGFENALPACLRVPEREPLRIGYFGSLYGGRSIDVLLNTIAALSAPLPRPTLHWYGELMGDHLLRDRFEEYAARGLLIHHPPVPYREARALMSSYHLLLVVPSPRYPEELTTKFYDYLDAGRPILALAPSGSLLHTLVERSRVGIAVPPTEPATLQQALETMVTRGMALYPERGALESHRLPALTHALMEVLDLVHSGGE